MVAFVLIVKVPYKKEAMMFTNLNSTVYTVSTLATIKN